MPSQSDTATDIDAPREIPEPDAVRRQLESILKHPLFLNSRRYPVLLRYVVEQVLEGNADQIKERSVGVLVFGRQATYDANADPIVRVTAGEIRKRLQQYYTEPEHAGELRIVLPVGSYVPRFETDPLVAYGAPSRVAKEQGLNLLPSEAQSKEGQRSSRTRLSIALAVGFLLLTVSGRISYHLYVKAHPHISLLEEFWSAPTQSSESVLLCVSDHSTVMFPETDAISDNSSTSRAGQGSSALSEARRKYGTVALADMLAAAKVVSVLAAKNISFQIRLDSITNLGDLRAGPVVLIGGFDNRWTMNAVRDLPYRFQRDPSNKSVGYIEDVTNPSRQRWTFDDVTPSSTSIRDYGIIARFPDSTTGQQTTIVAGMGRAGTEAAAEVLSSEAGLISLSKQLKADPAKVSFEAVISTEVMEGTSGQPVIVAIKKL